MVAALQSLPTGDGLERALYAELAVTHERLQESERLRSDLMRSLMLDLCLLINSLLTALDLSLTTFGNDSHTEAREFLELAIAGGKRVLKMISGLVDIAKAEDGAMPLTCALYQPLPIAQLAVMDVAELAQDHGVLCVMQDDGTYFAPLFLDMARIKQSLVRLLENAIKTADKGDAVTLCIQKNTLPSGAAVAFRVRRAAQDDPYPQPESFAAPGIAASPGHALTFARCVAEAHGGELRMPEMPNGGGAISLILPCKGN